MNWISVLGETTTVLSFAVFVGVVWFAYGKGRAARFDRAAQAPFDVPDELVVHGQAARRETKR